MRVLLTPCVSPYHQYCLPLCHDKKCCHAQSKEPKNQHVDTSQVYCQQLPTVCVVLTMSHPHFIILWLIFRISLISDSQLTSQQAVQNCSSMQQQQQQQAGCDTDSFN